MKDLKVIINFLRKIEHTDNCWIWMAWKNPQGYGRFFDGKKKVMAYRFSYELFKEGIPSGLVLDHLCRNPSCVNPDHLETVTMQENIRRGLTGKINHRNSRKTHCQYGHEFSYENLDVYEFRKGKRRCRLCKNTAMMKYRQKNVINECGFISCIGTQDIPQSPDEKNQTQDQKDIKET